MAADQPALPRYRPLAAIPGSYPSLTVDTTAKRVVSHAGAVLLAATAGRVGLDPTLAAPPGEPRSREGAAGSGDLGGDRGDCLANIVQVRSESALFGLRGPG